MPNPNSNAVRKPFAVVSTAIALGAAAFAPTAAEAGTNVDAAAKKIQRCEDTRTKYRSAIGMKVVSPNVIKVTIDPDQQRLKKACNGVRRLGLIGKTELDVAMSRDGEPINTIDNLVNDSNDDGRKVSERVVLASPLQPGETIHATYQTTSQFDELLNGQNIGASFEGRFTHGDTMTVHTAPASNN